MTRAVSLQDAEPGSPFHRLRGVFQETLLLVPGITDQHRRMALMLLLRTNEDIHAQRGELVSWIGVKTLAEALLNNRRTVQRGLAWLVTAGVLEIDRKGGGAGRSTHYRFSKQWLRSAALTVEKSGIGAAYGLGAKFYATINSVTGAALSPENGGAAPTIDLEKGGMSSPNSGAQAALFGSTTLLRVSNSGATTAVGGAQTGGKGGVQASAPVETAAEASKKGGAEAKNSGAAVPPETVRNIKNTYGRATKTAAPRKSAARSPDPRQGFLHHVVPGGRSTDSRSDTAPTIAPPQLLRNPNWQDVLLQRAEILLCDAGRARKALQWLDEGQKQRLAQGMRPNDEELAKWLGWALNAAEGQASDDSTVAEDSAGAPAMPLPQIANRTPPFAVAMPSPDIPTAVISEDEETRLARVERLAADTAATVNAMSRSIADLLTVLRPVLTAGTGTKSAA